jgi:protease II
MLVTAGLNDPRVTYWEPAKWVARLRELKTDGNELILKTNMGAGHGGKSGPVRIPARNAEEFAFILWQMKPVAGRDAVRSRSPDQGWQPGGRPLAAGRSA